MIYMFNVTAQRLFGNCIQHFQNKKYTMSIICDLKGDREGCGTISAHSVLKAIQDEPNITDERETLLIGKPRQPASSDLGE